MRFISNRIRERVWQRTLLNADTHRSRNSAADNRSLKQYYINVADSLFLLKINMLWCNQFVNLEAILPPPHFELGLCQGAEDHLELVNIILCLHVNKMTTRYKVTVPSHKTIQVYNYKMCTQVLRLYIIRIQITVLKKLLFLCLQMS